MLFNLVVYWLLVGFYAGLALFCLVAGFYYLSWAFSKERNQHDREYGRVMGVLMPVMAALFAVGVWTLHYPGGN